MKKSAKIFSWNWNSNFTSFFCTYSRILEHCGSIIIHTHLNEALIWLLLLAYPLYLQDKVKSRRSYNRIRLSLDVTKSYKQKKNDNKTIFFTWKQRFRKCWRNCVSFHGKKNNKKKTQIKYLIFSGHGLNTSYFSPLSIFASCRPYVNHCVILQHVSAIENATTVIGPHDCEFAVLKKKKKWKISSDFT